MDRILAILEANTATLTSHTVTLNTTTAQLEAAQAKIQRLERSVDAMRTESQRERQSANVDSKQSKQVRCRQWCAAACSLFSTVICA